ncbi:hypothetical protein [Desulfovibrio aminophilus]|uniref:hypothetical protein n=1 Tax=Desulfovibrio aminophilus TaxID=81425 RepID=UPI0012EB7DC2|nr:hypothetical protein [Desulfovibrio aminophilus]
MGNKKPSAEQFEKFKYFIRIDKDRRKKIIKELQLAVQKPPVSDEILKRIEWLGPTEIEDVLRSHPGHILDEAIKSIFIALDIFNRSWRDLCNAINEFNSFSCEKKFSHRENKNKILDIQSNVMKEIFCISSSALALIAASQKFESKMFVKGYREKIESRFINNKEHIFIKELRNNLNHGCIKEAEWCISYREGEKATSFRFSTKELLYEGEFNSLAKDYIKSCGEYIDVKLLFDSYVQSINSLYSWLKGNINNTHGELADYKRCIAAHRTNSIRCFWQMLFVQQFIPSKIDPYKYLADYLSDTELAEVSALPHRSKLQVDRIIEIVDKYNACNDEIRLLVYQLFGL